MKSLDKTFSTMAENPEYYGIAEKKYRQAKVSLFPYVIVYEVMDQEVIVFAVFHTARHPKGKYRE